MGGSTSSFVLNQEKQNTFSSAFLTPLFQESIAVLLKIQMEKTGVGKNFRETFYYRGYGEVGVSFFNCPKGSVCMFGFLWSVFCPTFSSILSPMTVFTGCAIPLWDGTCTGQCSRWTIKINLLMLKSSYSEVFMLLIKFMAWITSAGNNSGDLLPSSHSADICNLCIAVNSV